MTIPLGVRACIHRVVFLGQIQMRLTPFPLLSGDSSRTDHLRATS